MSLIGKAGVGASISFVETAAPGTRWERKFNRGVVAYQPLPQEWLKGLLWTLTRPLRRWRKARLEREIVNYMHQIEREGYRPREVG
ncbi:MAG: hypothetical protein V1755_02630 [Chloroflexota bacterium]